MHIQDIDISLIDVPADRRVIDQRWSEAIAADMAKNGQIVPIEVVATGDRYRLISGAHRIGARNLLGVTDVQASIRQMSEFRSEADLKLREIAENMMRRGLSVLDKACDVARWRELYEAMHGAVKAGRKKNGGKSAPISEDEIESASEAFALSFTAAAQAALGINKDAIKRAIRIAAISRNARMRLSLLPIADNQSELLSLAAESADRQEQIVALLTSEPVSAVTVEQAIRIIDRVPEVSRPEMWERMSSKFAKLPETAKKRFVLEHWDVVEQLLAEQASRKAA